MKLKKFIPEIVIGAIIICAFLLIGKLLLDLRERDNKFLQEKESKTVDVSINNPVETEDINRCILALENLRKHRELGNNDSCKKYIGYLKSFSDSGEEIEKYVKELHSEIK